MSASERNPAVLEKVREKLEKYPEVKSKQLHDMAIRMDTSLAAMSLRSFHARYVLPLMRERARAEGRIKPRKPRKRAASKQAATAAANVRQTGDASDSGKSSQEERARVRAILLRLARDVADAESRADLVDLIGGIDAVVDDILKR